MGDYAFYDKNPLNQAVAHHVGSVWTAASAAKLDPTVYVGQLPVWDVGADEVHLSLGGATLFGLTVDAETLDSVLTGNLHYPQDYLDARMNLDGPGRAGETIEHFTIRDAANVWKAAAAGKKPPRYMFVWAFIALDDNPTNTYGADGPELAKVVDDYDDAIGDLLSAIKSSPYAGRVNVLFTLDHGKVDTTNQVALGDAPGDHQQLANLVAAQGADHGVGPNDYAIVNEDGDALLYAKVANAGTAAGAAAQEKIAHGLVELVQSGKLQGVDTTRTITWDGYLGTRRFHDYRIETPHQADVLVFPQDGWTLNDVDKSGVPGPFDPTKHPDPYGRHGGFSQDELYVPLILWGPAFKAGVYLPHPVDHADVAPTAMRALGATISDAEGAPIYAAFKGDPGEAPKQPADGSTIRDLVLNGSGYGASLAAPVAPAQQAVVVDVAGLYADELTDPATAAKLANVLALAKSGTSFENMWTRSRDFAENQYELLAGGAPVVDASGAWVAEADSDPAQTAPPGEGFLLEPPAPLGTPANPDALARWRTTDDFGQQSLLSAAPDLGLAAAAIETTPGALAHFAPDANVATSTASDHGESELKAFFTANPRAIAYVSFGGKRAKDRHSAAALAELKSIDDAVHALRLAAPNALFVLTSRGATDVDDPSGDFYGPQSSRHVPLVIAGPGVEKGRVTSEPAEPADVPATVLYGLGVATHSDFVEGTWADAGAQPNGMALPIPTGATGGHVLARAFLP